MISDRALVLTLYLFDHVTKFTKMYRQLMGVQQLSRRTITVNNTVKEKQKLFQEDNGIPVHLKGGMMDALLCGATCVWEWMYRVSAV